METSLKKCTAKHRTDKERAQGEKAPDKAEASLSDGDTVVVTKDLQSVLLSPSLNASSPYYRTKLCVHNFTILIASPKTSCATSGTRQKAA